VKIVIDTSALLAVLINEPEKSQIIANTKGATLVAPYSVHWEIGNVLSAMLRKKRLTKGQPEKILAAYSQIPVTYVDVDLEASVNICEQFDIYAYDAYLLSCALSEQCSLLTLDKQLSKVATKMGIQIVELGES
jgi:predicted nucleic acid-binding protein